MSLIDQLHNIARNGQLKFADIEFGTCTDFSATRFSANAEETTTSPAADRRYLVASITKPLIAMAVLKLAAEGLVSLSDRIGSVLPDFSRAAYRRITVRHLLTHTSGFPDMLPNNRELRAAHASVHVFRKEAASAELEFATGTECRYSSVGYLILGELIQQLTNVSAGEYLRRQIFEPCGMVNTWLGLNDEQAATVLPTLLPCELPIWQPDAEDWGWNSSYWRMLGAAWGGMVSTAEDLGKLARMLLSDGQSELDKPVLHPELIRASFENQLLPIAVDPIFAGNQRPWGFGWRRQWAAHHASFGDFVSNDTVGHWGATGTLIWMDLTTRRYAVFLTTTPYEISQSPIQRMSNLVALKT